MKINSPVPQASCLFCKIVRKEIPARVLSESEHFIAFADINPQAPVHFLVVPKKHAESIEGFDVSETALLGGLLKEAARLADSLKVGGGYRVVVNRGENGGQTVGHLHFHVMGGRPMHWPPG